jgi:hypothetical protein
MLNIFYLVLLSNTSYSNEVIVTERVRIIPQFGADWCGNAITKHKKLKYAKVNVNRITVDIIKCLLSTKSFVNIKCCRREHIHVISVSQFLFLYLFSNRSSKSHTCVQLYTLTESLSLRFPSLYFD